MMKSIEDKLKVLAEIGEKLNSENITWAIGASLLLYFNGITDDFNDIDIMVTESDVIRLKEILLSLGSMNPPNYSAKYKTRHFYEFTVGGVDIDVMAGFIIVDNGREYDCSLSKEQIVGYKTVNGVDIPLQSVSLWKEYYKLMHRDNKVEMIENSLK